MRNSKKERYRQLVTKAIDEKLDEYWGKDRAMYDCMTAMKDAFLEMLDNL